MNTTKQADERESEDFETPYLSEGLKPSDMHLTDGTQEIGTVVVGQKSSYRG